MSCCLMALNVWSEIGLMILVRRSEWLKRLAVMMMMMLMMMEDVQRARNHPGLSLNLEKIGGNLCRVEASEDATFSWETAKMSASRQDRIKCSITSTGEDAPWPPAWRYLEHLPPGQNLRGVVEFNQMR